MSSFETRRLPTDWDEVAPDGSYVRKLMRLASGDMAHFEMPAGETSTAELHPEFEEIWFFIGGRGQMWRKQGEREEVVELERGVCISIPKGTVFQFRA